MAVDCLSWVPSSRSVSSLICVVNELCDCVCPNVGWMGVDQSPVVEDGWMDGPDKIDLV